MHARRLRIIAEHLKAGKIIDMDEPYLRKVPVPWLVLIPFLVCAILGKFPFAIVSLLRGSTMAMGGERRSLKKLRQGPEILVTPLRMRTLHEQEIEIEIHGYIHNNNRLKLNDRVRAELYSQRRADLPPRARRIYNLTTGRTIAPHPNTIWTHFGISLIIQSIIGFIIAIFTITVWAM